MDDVVALASEIETGPASRELSDRFLLAVGWKREFVTAYRDVGGPYLREVTAEEWTAPDGSGFRVAPDCTRSIDAIASIEREIGVDVNVVGSHADGTFLAVAGMDDGQSTSDFFARTSGDHAEVRARCAALLRAIAASRVAGEP